ncbi:hypothetical protein DYB32_002608 [Aphanomyces invadans]|uniref:DDHD domain-containing protein n=1 Tax=Aphanomyces invadans TaxID=157072 RepID=A0A3R6Z2E7_9STRA|nr:hypothetical protein DYB32_002608 [Aphanomyces invadans]
MVRRYGVWAEYSAGDGWTYFYNEETKESAWEMPIEVREARGEMQAMLKTALAFSGEWGAFDAGFGTIYYFHLPSKHSSWERPPEWGQEPEITYAELAMQQEAKQAHEIARPLPPSAPNSTTTTETTEDDKTASEETEEERAESIQRIEAFRQMLRDKQIMPYCKWEAALPRIALDDRFRAIPTMDERRAIYEHFLKHRKTEIAKEGKANFKIARKAFRDGLTQALDQFPLDQMDEWHPVALLRHAEEKRLKSHFDDHPEWLRDGKEWDDSMVMPDLLVRWPPAAQQVVFEACQGTFQARRNGAMSANDLRKYGGGAAKPSATTTIASLGGKDDVMTGTFDAEVTINTVAAPISHAAKFRLASEYAATGHELLALKLLSYAGALAKAVDVLLGGMPTEESNQVSVGDSNLAATIQVLSAIQSAAGSAIALLTTDKQIIQDDVKHDEKRLMEEPAVGVQEASLAPPGAPTQQADEAPTKAVDSGVYVHETDAEFEATDDPAVVQAESFPTEILLENINHLMFIVHGIGEHNDFVVESYDNDKGSTGDSGNFRELFNTMRHSLFSKCVPDATFQGPHDHRILRDVNKRLIMDVLYYSAPKYGQVIVDTVTKQMNDKYTSFMAANPGWQGFVSIFAHSLGTLITYDILTHDAGQVGSNGVVFPGLSFPVENLFCVGSPVPIFALSRGALDIHDGVCTGGLRRPNVNHYFNLFHPADPIAYRVEPLVDVDMSSYPAIALQPVRCAGITLGSNVWGGLQADTFKNKTFGEMVLTYDKLTDTAPLCNEWQGARIDFQVRRKFLEGPVDTLYAPLAHSVYWSSEDVVTITLLAICRPVVDILTRYIDHKMPLPTLRPRRRVPFTPHKTIQCATTAVVRDGFTGAWEPHALFLGKKRVYFTRSAADVACSKKWSVPLTNKTAVVADPTDATAFQFIPDKTNPSPSLFSTTKGAQTLYTTSSDQRNEWVDNITKTLAALQTKTGHGTIHANVSGLALPSGTDVDFFDATLTGTLRTKGTFRDAYNWYVLTDCSLDCYEACPKLKEWTHFSLKAVFATPEHGHIRLVSRHGTSVTFKIPDKSRFDLWLNTIKQFPDCHLVLDDSC